MPDFISFINNRPKSRLAQPDLIRLGHKSGFTLSSRLLLLFLLQFLISLNHLTGQSAGDYRTNGNTQFNLATNWQVYDGIAWVAASVDQSLTSGVITFRNDHTATLTSYETLDQLIIEATAILRINGTRLLTLAECFEPFEMEVYGT